MNSEFEKELLKQLNGLHDKRCGELCSGMVPTEMYQAHLAKISTIREVFVIWDQANKKVRAAK